MEETEEKQKDSSACQQLRTQRNQTTMFFSHNQWGI